MKRLRLGKRHGGKPKPAIELVDAVWSASREISQSLAKLASSDKGLVRGDIRRRIKQFGHNEIASGRKKAWYRRLFDNFRDPLSLLLLALAVISYFTSDIRGAILITMMLVLSVTLRYFQEYRADKASEELKAMVRTTATVLREGVRREIPMRCVVPGDVVLLSAGDMVPADIRLISSRDLFINQASLTGESLPVEKLAQPAPPEIDEPLDLPNVCFMGTNVASGTAEALVIATGPATRFGALAAAVAAQAEAPTSFDRGIDRYTWLMIRFVAIMVPLVFLINGFSRGDWVEAFLFALAVAVGLTPEMLPMIVTVNLSKGSLDMARQKVIVKRLNAIQDFGAMDVLCTDKTGTLTQGKVVLERHIDLEGVEREEINDYAFLNSYYQTGLTNLMDEAVKAHDPARTRDLPSRYKKIDELPFDFGRRRMSVVVEDRTGEHLLICKGAVEEILSKSTKVMINGKAVDLEAFHRRQKDDVFQNLSSQGFRLVALAYRKMPAAKKAYSVKDEEEMALLGFLAFLDPPKETAAKAIGELNRHGIAVKILTGDNDLVTRKICDEVGLAVGRIMKGEEIDRLDDAGLEAAVEDVSVFAKLDPAHKERIIRAVQKRGHVVGFLGDGINDAPALKAADVGVSVDKAVDIAKESSDIILLEHSLTVLKDGVIEGRKAFGNIVKYIKMAASSNFGNMFSVVGGSIFLPFVPMLPLQVIVNNLFYDLSQTTIPTDQVDQEYLLKPRKWRIDRIRQFILFIGPISSIFDFATFALMLYVFKCWTNPALFHTGWFVESLLTQTLVIHVIRTNKIPFIQSRASLPLTLTTLGIAALGAWLPFSPLASALGFAPLPALYWLYIAGFLATYFILTQLVKNWFTRRFGWD